MSTQWLHVPANAPLPDVAAAAADPRLRGLITLRLAIRPEHPLDGHGDYEDFVERTLRTHNAIAAVGPDNLWIDAGDGTAWRYSDGRTRQGVSDMPVIGMTPVGSMCHGSLPGSATIGGQMVQFDQLVKFDDYADSPTFLAQNRRHVELVSDSLDDVLDAVLRALPLSADRSVWVKGRAAKSFIARLRAPRGWEHGLTDTYAAAAALQGDGLSLLELLGYAELGPASVLIAPHVDMSLEYRFFLVDGRVVAGAGCIEHHTPLDAGPEVFDDRVETRRGNGEITRQPRAVLDMLQRVEELSDDFAAEGRRTGVIDMAMVDGAPVIIELNGLNNAGFYASNVDVIYRAWARVPHQALAETFAPLSFSDDT